jgi:hypothetical protein
LLAESSLQECHGRASYPGCRENATWIGSLMLIDTKDTDIIDGSGVESHVKA